MVAPENAAGTPRRMPQDVRNVAVLWAISTVLCWLAWYWISGWVFSEEGAEEAHYSDTTYNILTYMGTPVATLVMVVVFYSLLNHRIRTHHGPKNPPKVFGANFHHNSRVATVWLSVTSVLAIGSVFWPGLVELNAIRGEPTADLIVEVSGAQWAWTIDYPEYGVTAAPEVFLPVDKRVEFQITSVDVLHDWWIPAFRLKIDAVPGQTTIWRATPTVIRSWEEDPTYRAQCAELCGKDHGTMKLNVNVMSQEDFEATMAALSGAGTAEDDDASEDTDADESGASEEEVDAEETTDSGDGDETTSASPLLSGNLPEAVGVGS